MTKNGSPLQYISRLTSSPLARALGLGFLLLAALEAAFISFLVADVLAAERSASREYLLLKASARMSDCAEAMKKHRSIVDDWRFDPRNSKGIILHQQSCSRIMQETKLFVDGFAAANLDAGSANRLRATMQEICSITSRIFQLGASEESRNQAYTEYLTASSSMYQQALQEMKLLHSLLSDTTNSAANAESWTSLRLILLEALFLNILLAGLMAYLIHRTVSDPIANLAAACMRLKGGEVIPPPATLKNEISALEQTFHNMSLTFSQDEKGRQSYIHLLKDLQGASLQQARDLLGELELSAGEHKKRKERFQLLKSTVDSMMHLLESMTEGLRFDPAATIQLELVTVDSTALLNKAVSAVQPLLDKKSINFRCVEPGVEIRADEHLLLRLLVNLLSNAIKFSPKNSDISLLASVSSSRFRCEIHDSGAGISEADQKKLFQKFSQLDLPEDLKQSGSGLGLMISRQIVEAHGGTIGCTSEVGQGSCFWFELALAMPVHEKDESVASAVSVNAAAENSDSLKKKNSKRGSIKTNFIVMIVFFLIMQFGVAVTLGATFKEATERAQSYSRQKGLIIDTQQLLILFLAWRQQAAEAVQSWSLDSLKAPAPLLQEQIDLCQRLGDSVPASNILPAANNLKEIFLSIRKRELLVQKIYDLTLANFSNLTKASLVGTVSRVDVIGMDIEGRLFQALRLERVDLDRSYDLSAKLRSEVLLLIILVFASNLFLILVLAILSARIIDRIQEISVRAREFAMGGSPDFARAPNDEIGYLDRTLCDVAHSIRNAELQRQQLLAVVNHDLRTPLASVLGGLELARAGILGVLGSEDLKTVDQAEIEMRRHLEQINDLLAIERLDAGLIEADAALVVLNEVLEECVSVANASWHGRALVKYECQDAAEDVMVRAELNALFRVFKALMDNAAQAYNEVKEVNEAKDVEEAASASSPNLTSKLVLVKLRLEGAILIVHVKDYGKGIDPDLTRQVFERFRFVRGKPLTGMGLPLADRLLRLYGAKLSIESSSAQGTSVRIDFPAVLDNQN